MKRIMAFLQGGLGNQCFIYAAARAAAFRTGADIVLDGSYLVDDVVYRRKFALAPFCCITDLPSVSVKPVRLFRRCRYALLRDRVSQLGNYICDRRPFKFRPLPADWSGELVLDGYFQSERYFCDVRKSILDDFQLKDDSWLNADAFAGEIRNTDQSIFLHVRSYKEVPGKEDGECALRMIGYYRSAIDYMNAHVPGGKLFVFSDDVEWAKANVLSKVQTISRLPIVFNTPKSSQLRDFSLMRLCRHGIVADSSFSWWAGWLGEQEHLACGGKPIRVHVNRRVMNDDYWPERWVAI